ncbi:MAG TPA: hypothetical protein VFY18_05975 [Candidatus Limnocylindrales bacterium]|nr:hypothetical protein [Candidatus Limnocylindrales bacterium]
MDGLVIFLMASGAMLVLGMLAAGYGVDSREGIDDLAHTIGR